MPAPCVYDRYPVTVKVRRMTDIPDGGTAVEKPNPTEAFPYFLYLCTSLNPWADLNMVRAMRETRGGCRANR